MSNFSFWETVRKKNTHKNQLPFFIYISSIFAAITTIKTTIENGNTVEERCKNGHPGSDWSSDQNWPQLSSIRKLPYKNKEIVLNIGRFWTWTIHSLQTLEIGITAGEFYALKARSQNDVIFIWFRIYCKWCFSSPSGKVSHGRLI